MKYARVLIVVSMVLAVTSPAWAQRGYSLYGSPELLSLPSANPSAVPQYAYPGTPVQPSYAPAADHVAYTFPFSSSSPSHLEPAAPKGPRVVRPMPDKSEANDDQPADLNTSGCGMIGSCGMESTCSLPVGCEPCCASLWYARAAWLIMGRDQPNTLWTTYEDGNNANQIPTEIHTQWGNGGQITVGRQFCCGCWALEGTYWGLGPIEGDVSITHLNGVSTPLDFTDVVYANPIAGLPVDLFDGADEHRVWRRDEVHNFELNLVRNGACGCCVDPCCGGFAVDWLVGVRYFRFKEDWAFRSLRQGGAWANPAEVGNLEDDITNNLIGFQFGANLNYQCHKDWRLFARPKLGIYNNHIENTFRAYRGDGELFAPDPASGVPGTYPVHSTVNGISFLAEVDLGIEWQFAPRWSAMVGYRVLAATGIGLADNQIPPYVVDIPEIAAIDRNGQLVLHGAFAGLEYRF